VDRVIQVTDAVNLPVVVGSALKRLWEAVTWRITGYRSMARSLYVMATWDRAQRVPVSIPYNHRVPVIFCTWQRLERIRHILNMLADQDVPVQALIWNNSPNREFVEKATASARIPVQVYHSPGNIGSFGRFYLAREVAESGYQRLIIIDDDEDFGPDMTRELLAGCPPRSLSAWFAHRISRQDIWRRTVPEPGERVNYVGPGGMAADAAVFADPRLFSCPRRFWFLDDVWLSWYAANFADYTLLRSAVSMEFVEDSLNQFPRLQWIRQRFWRYLSRRKVPGREILQEWE
jgi:hypothetical protein